MTLLFSADTMQVHYTHFSQVNYSFQGEIMSYTHKVPIFSGIFHDKFHKR